MRCADCNDTGSLSKELDGDLDCSHCGVAYERVVFNKWMHQNQPYVQTAAAWLIYQHGKAAALPPCYRLVPVDPENPCKS